MAGELRKKILEADDIREELISVPEWGTDLLIRGMTGKERAKFIQSATSDGDTNVGRFYADLIISTAYDPESRELVFDRADRDALNQKSGSAINLVAEKAMALSGLGRDVKETAKDLDVTPNESST